MRYEDTRRGFTAKVNTGALHMAARFYGRNGKPPSYQSIADMCGVSKSTVSNLWTGRRPTVNPETASKIEDGLRVDKGSIFSLLSLTR